MSKTSIDLNCDMGEGFGPWIMGKDSELLRYISSASIACGFHAGDASVMRRTVEQALRAGVSIGAHPSYPDLQGFGRREMHLTSNEVFDITLYQVAALKGICESLGARLSHVKPHGALYNVAARDAETARAIIEAVKSLDSTMAVYGLSGGVLTDLAKKSGLKAIEEAFVDRSYGSDGSLIPRRESGALVSDLGIATSQALRLAKDNSVISKSGETVKIAVDSLCIHGDGPNAVEIAKSVRQRLDEAGITVRPVTV